MLVVPKPELEPGFDSEIDHGHAYSGVVHDYCLVRYIQHCQIKKLDRYGYEGLVAYALLTDSGDPSTF